MEPTIYLIAALIGSLIVPHATAVVTTRMASSRLKATVTLVLSVLTGGLTAVIQADGNVNVTEWLGGMVTAFLAANTTYQGLLKQLGTTEALQKVTEGFGIGQSDKP